MSYSRHVTGRNSLDTAFKLFGAVAIAIAVGLSATVIALTTPVGTYITPTPAALGTVVFTALLVGAGYAAYAVSHRIDD